VRLYTTAETLELVPGPEEGKWRRVGTDGKEGREGGKGERQGKCVLPQFSSVQFVTLLKQNVLRGCRLA